MIAMAMNFWMTKVMAGFYTFVWWRTAAGEMAEGQEPRRAREAAPACCLLRCDGPAPTLSRANTTGAAQIARSLAGSIVLQSESRFYS
jgi:hypothetical protein